MEVIMVDFPHLKKAPIVEATFEIRCNIAVDKLKTLFEKQFKLNFSELKTQSISFNPLKGDLSIPAPTTIGIEARTETDIIQIKKDGILFSRIKEYESFDNINKYIQAVFHENIIEDISRIGCRYINVFSIKKDLLPDKFYNLSIYEETSSLKQQIFKREVSKIDSFDVILINNIMQNNDMLNITLDIDVSKSEQINTQQINEIISKITELKNKIFFSYIKTYEEVFN